MSRDWLVLGLGNPGGEYEDTRHNIGFMVVDQWAEVSGVKFQASATIKELRLTKFETQDKEGEPYTIYLAKPLTYMNLSGRVVNPLLRAYDIAPQHMIVVYDDQALPFGKLRARAKGSSGGHNGMKSIIAALGNSEDFPRLRVGIDAPHPSRDLKDHVLEPFSAEEQRDLPEIIQAATASLKVMMEYSPQASAQWVNGWSLGQPLPGPSPKASKRKPKNDESTKEAEQTNPPPPQAGGESVSQ